MIGAQKLPLAFSEAIFLDLTKDTSWLHESLNNLFLEMEMEPLDEDEDVGDDPKLGVGWPIWSASGVVDSRQVFPQAHSSPSEAKPHNVLPAHSTISTDGKLASRIPITPQSAVTIKITSETDQVARRPIALPPENSENRKLERGHTEGSQLAGELKTTIGKSQFSKPSLAASVSKTWRLAVEALKGLLPWS